LNFILLNLLVSIRSVSGKITKSNEDLRPELLLLDPFISAGLISRKIIKGGGDINKFIEI